MPKFLAEIWLNTIKNIRYYHTFLIFEETSKMEIKSVRYIICFLFIIPAFSGFSQQGAILMPMELDSTQLEINQQFENEPMISGGVFSEPLNPITRFPQSLPNFDFNQNNVFSVEFNKLNSLFDTGFSLASMGTFYTPFFHDATILSQGAYSLGNKLVLGGFSYGANSVFSAPLPNQNSTNFDAYGNTIFLQYKVSKNFKIETRFNVTHGPGPGF